MIRILSSLFTRVRLPGTDCEQLSEKKARATAKRQKDTVSKFENSHIHTCLTASIRKSNLHDRQSVPRALQCLYSRWRLGQVDS